MFDLVVSREMVLRKPQYVIEADSNVYRIVSLIESEKDNANNLRYGLIDQSEGLLESGLDISEIPNRNLKLYVDKIIGRHPFYQVISEVRKYANIAGADYFSVEGKIEESFKGYLVIPRLFRKILDN